VQTIGGQNIGVLINNMDTTDVLKNRMFKWTGIPPSRQHLIYGDKLEDGVSFGNYGLIPGATVTMAISDDDWEAFSFQTFVRLPNGDTQIIRLTSSDSVAYVKRASERLCGLKPQDQRLLSGLYELREGYSLSDYNIHGTMNLKVLERIHSDASDSSNP